MEDEKVELELKLIEELEDRSAPDLSDMGWRLAANHNEILVRDQEG